MTGTDKTAVRKKIREMRRALTEDYLRENSARITHFLTGTEAWKTARTVYLYAALGGEVRTDLLAKAALKDGKCVAYPAVRGKDMVFYAAENTDVFRTGAFGIPEPQGGRVAEEPGLMCVPGLAFDGNGGRIGQGGGYYDRYLASHKDLVTAGLAFSFQIMAELPVTEPDRPVQIVVTEKGIL